MSTEDGEALQGRMVLQAQELQRRSVLRLIQVHGHAPLEHVDEFWDQGSPACLTTTASCRSITRDCMGPGQGRAQGMALDNWNMGSSSQCF